MDTTYITEIILIIKKEIPPHFVNKERCLIYLHSIIENFKLLMIPSQGIFSFIIEILRTLILDGISIHEKYTYKGNTLPSFTEVLSSIYNSGYIYNIRQYNSTQIIIDECNDAEKIYKDNATKEVSVYLYTVLCDIVSEYI